MKNNDKKHVVIIGAGFSAPTAAQALRQKSPEIRISIIAPEPTFLYYPSLIWIPTGLRKGSDIQVSLQRYFNRHRLDYIQARVTGLDKAGRVVLTDQGAVANDALLIASGGRFLKKLPGIEHAHTLCEGIAAAEAIRDRLTHMDGGHIAFGFASNPAEPAAMRGGPMFELLFGIETWLSQQGKRDQFTLTFFSPAAKPGSRLGEKAVTKLLQEMEQRGIHTVLGEKIMSFSEQEVLTEGTQIQADLILFMPGMTGPDWLEQSGLTLTDGGFIQADAYCQAVNADKVFVVGDAGSFPGPDWMPKQAHIADLQAKTAAHNLLDTLEGKSPSKRFRPELICIIDTLDAGILIYRDIKHAWTLPRWSGFHLAKKVFERLYLRKLRQ